MLQAARLQNERYLSREDVENFSFYEHHLSREDIENFPCEDLRTIDRLWVHYSKGKFGFSVQRQIWRECGSPTEYNDDLIKFFYRVGWCRDRSWVLDYRHSTTNLEESKMGELPKFGFRVGMNFWASLCHEGQAGRLRQYSGEFASSLAYRLANCSIQ